MGSLSRKVQRAAARKRRPRKFVYIGELPDGDRYIIPHPQGGIIVVHPDHPPVWHRPDGTKQTIKG
jgi:hypothetical protein